MLTRMRGKGLARTFRCCHVPQCASESVRSRGIVTGAPSQDQSIILVPQRTLGYAHSCASHCPSLSFLCLLQIVTLGMGIAVGMARKKFGIGYPSLYAVPGTKANYAPAGNLAEDSALIGTSKNQVRSLVATTLPKFVLFPQPLPCFIYLIQSQPGGFAMHDARAASHLVIPPHLQDLVSDETAYAFNCIQRGHQNFLEQVPCFVPLIIINWFTFPLIAGICGIAWVILKVGYFVGYSQGVSSRLWGAGAYFPQLTLYGITIWSAIVLFQRSDKF